MKWLLIITFIFVIMIIALSVSEQYKDKYNFYVNLKLFLEKFKLNLAFKQEKLDNFLNSIKSKKQFRLFIDEYKRYLETNELDLSKIQILEQDEIAELKEIITSVGRLDQKGELEQTECFLKRIEPKLRKANEDMTKLCPMIIKLSLLFAVGLAILLI